ncbi:hypothetical protein SCUP515_02388 [Seiridium cupressi]
MKVVRAVQNCVFHILGPLSSRADCLEPKAKLTKYKSSSRDQKRGVTAESTLE